MFIKYTKSLHLPVGKMNEVHAWFRINEKKSCVTTVQTISDKRKRKHNKQS